MMEKGSLGRKVKEARLHLKLTQKDLAGDFITRNMLSQIENDQASPSLKTMEYIANKLDKPLSYFMDEKIEVKDEKNQNIFSVLNSYNEGKYQEVIRDIEQMMRAQPMLSQNQLLNEVLFNAYFKYGRHCRLTGQFSEGIDTLEKLCTKRGNLIFDYMHLYYGALMELSELYTLANAYEKGQEKLKEAETLLEKQKQTKEIQQLFNQLYDDQPDKVISKAKDIAYENLDSYQRAKYLYVLASAQKSKKEFGKALKLYRLVVDEIVDKKYVVILKLTYEGMADCFSQLGDYKNAYEMIRKASAVY